MRWAPVTPVRSQNCVRTGLHQSLKSQPLLPQAPGLSLSPDALSIQDFPGLAIGPVKLLLVDTSRLQLRARADKASDHFWVDLTRASHGHDQILNLSCPRHQGSKRFLDYRKLEGGYFSDGFLSHLKKLRLGREHDARSQAPEP